jgi:hypothetical protein
MSFSDGRSYLVTNRFRPRVLAIQKTRPIAYRAKVLGRALLAARTDANSFWMLLSGNAEVVFSSPTVTTTPAANLPTPAATNAAAPANVVPIVAAATAAATAAAAAAITVTASRAASTAGAAPAVNVTSPSASQKRNFVLSPTRDSSNPGLFAAFLTTKAIEHCNVGTVFIVYDLAGHE